MAKASRPTTFLTAFADYGLKRGGIGALPLDKVGILIVSKCLSSAAIIDTFARSERYAPEFYVAERQVNPLNFKRAKVHQVIPDLNVADVAKFASRHEKQIAFGLTDTEDFVTAGGRDIVERETGVPMLCVTKEFAVEASKADQRLLFEKICPKANPRYKVFDPSKYPNEDAAVADLRSLSKELDGGFAIKPDAPARGAGVGVSGKDFQTEEEAVGVLPERLLERKGHRRGAHRGGGVELPRLQRRAPFHRRPADQRLQARPRRRQGQAHRWDGELQRPQRRPPVPASLRVGEGGAPGAGRLREVEGEGVEPRPPRDRALRRPHAHARRVQDPREEQQGRKHRADLPPDDHARRLRGRLLQDGRRQPQGHQVLEQGLGGHLRRAPRATAPRPPKLPGRPSTSTGPSPSRRGTTETCASSPWTSGSTRPASP